MNISPLGIAVIQLFEEYVDKAYRRFPHEPWTCGWGHTRGVTETTTCTPEIALQWLKEDVAEASAAVNVLNYGFTQHQFDALVSLTYNIGVGNFAKAAELHSALMLKQWGVAAGLFLRFDHIDGVENKGLKRRRELESAVFLDGVTT
jgi:lysozyme